MRDLADQLLTEFTEVAAPYGWNLDFVEDGDCALFSRPNSPDVEAGLTIDLTPRSYGLSLNPTIGVRHVDVSELTSRFFGLAGRPSQVGTSLSGLVRAAGDGRGVMWVVEAVEEISPMVRKVLADIETYGTPFFAPYTSLRDINRKLALTATMNFQLAPLAVGYALDGDEPSARSVLVRIQEWMEKQPPLVVRQTEKFVAGFSAHFGVAVNGWTRH